MGPEVVSVTPVPDATNVPTDVYLELGFNQPMDPDSVLASTLRITDVTGGDDVPDAHEAGYYFDIQIGAAKDDELVTLVWNSDYTILKMTTNYQHGGNQFTLAANNNYKLQMVDNNAKAAGVDGLPLILGGAINLLSG